MKIDQILESRDLCQVCGQTPCNCTHLTESADNIGAQIRAAYQKIYNAGDDAIEFMYYDSPIFAQYWDEYEGDLDSIIAEVEPSELQIILDELQSAAEDQGVAEGLNEFAPGGGGESGDYLKALASAWYNGTFDSGSLQKGIKSQEDVERLLNRGIVCPDGKTRKLHIDYNSDFDGVEIYSDDYYEHGDLDGNDGRTGQPWGPWDHMEFKDEELDEGVTEGLNEFAPAGGGGNIPRGPWGDNGEDPYQLRRYNRSVDFFDQFDSDGVDKQNFDKATGEYEGYYFDRDAASGITQIAYFKFDDPTKIGDNDPGIGWYYEPIDEGVAEGYSLGKVLPLPELLDQIKHILTAKHPGIGWRMTMPAENTFLFSAKNDYDVWSMLVVEPGGDDWVAVGHGMVDPDGKPIIFDRQQLPMTLASASEIADEAIQTYHDIDLSDYADDEDYNQGMAEGKKKSEPPEADYGDDYQAMVSRVKKLAGLGPLRTVYDPQKRVYKNVPTAVQPKKEQR